MNSLDPEPDYPHHQLKDANIRELILGFNDGLVSNLALVAALSGALVTGTIVVLAGAAEMFAGALSMFFAVYLGTRSEIEYYDSEVEREKREIEEIPDQERQEIRDIYAEKGFKGKQLEDIVKTITADKTRWLNVMLREELMLPGTFKNPVKAGGTTAVAFVAGALVPILPFIIIHDVAAAIPYAAAFSAVILFLAGVAKTKITRKHWLRSGLEMVAIGLFAAFVTYFIGNFLGVNFF